MFPSYREGSLFRRAPHTSCPLCGAEVSRANLQRHIRTHTGVKLFACVLCGYSTGDKSNFRRHLVKRHPGESDDLLALSEQAIPSDQDG